MIPRDTVNLILDTARIEDVVGDFVTLKRRGANYVACCPFHNEKTPSFYVSPAKGIYKCFGCGKSGSAVGFVMEHEHCSYSEALRYLASKYKIDVVEEEETAEEIALRQRRESLLLVSEFAQKYFAEQLSTPEGRSVGYAYLRGRGLEDDTIRRFGLGWAPSGRTALIDAAKEAGYKLEYLIAAGLAVQREDGTVVDKFRERVMFPIHSVSGRVLAFSGRTLHADNPAKYVNSPETEIYVKSRQLLGIWFAKAEIARSGKCILVEGNVDMVTLHQLGITNVVASLGTSLTVEQIRLIHKFTENVTIMYDGDSAGIHAALRGLGLVLQEGLNVKIVLLPEGEDPDSFGRKHTLQEVQDYIAAGERDFIEFKTDLLLSEAGSDPLKKAELINDIADTIAQIPDAVKRSVYVETVSLRFNIEQGILFDRITRVRKKMQEDVLRDRQRRTGQQIPGQAGNDGISGNDVSSGISVRSVSSGVPSTNSWDYGGDTPGVDSGVSLIENRTLAPAERDLLYFLLTYGSEQLDFETDSPYYSGSEDDKPTVAQFIREALEDDGTVFANSAYRKLYDAYMQLYDSGLGQEAIVKSMLDGADRTLAALAASFSTEKYQLTVGAFEAALTSRTTFLVTGVPKAIMVYAERRVQDRIDAIRRSLASASPREQLPLMQEMLKLQAAQRRINQKIGREKTDKQ
ncbi:MAG: DNA primase [Bacteroidales bacterium]|nr:DNA primase [Bacteroidales bacterium]